VAEAGAHTSSVAEVARSFEVTFYGENADVDWVSSARSTLQGRVSTLIPRGTVINSLECRSSMCRAELLYDGVESYRTFMDTFRQYDNSPWTDGYVFSKVEDETTNGSISAVTYFGRPGQPPPSF
jgi:hypothetical protein